MKLIAGQRLRLSDENAFVKIISGKLELYAVTRKQKSFRQIFLMELPTGAAVFPALDEFEYIDFQIYAMTDAELEVMQISDLPPSALRALMTRWFSELEKLAWIKIFADKGDEILLSWRAKKVFSAEKTLAQVKSTFEENEQILTMLLGMRLRSEEVQFTKRRYNREKNKHLLLDETVSELLDEEVTIHESSESKNKQLSEAAFIVRNVARALSMPFENLEIDSKLTKKLDQVGVIRRLIQKGGMQMRLVELKGNWYKKDCGVLIGYYGEKKMLAALIPDSPTSYKIFTKENETGMRVDSAVAALIDSDAFSCYAGFPTKQLNKVDILRFMLTHCRKTDLYSIIVISFLAGLIPIITPIITETIFQDIIPMLERSSLATVTQVSMVSGFTLAAIGVVRSISTLRLVTNIDLAVESALFGRMLSLPTKFFRQFQSGELANRFIGAEMIVNSISGDLFAQIFNFLFSFWSLLLMCWYSLKLTALAIGISFVWSLVSAILIRRIIKFQRELTIAHNKTTGILQQIFAGLAKFRIQGNEEQAYHLWGKSFSVEWDKKLKLRWQSNYTVIIGIIQASLSTLLMYYVVMHYVNELDADGKIIKEGITYASYIAFQAAYSGFNGTLGAFIVALGNFLSLKPLVENLQPFFDETPESSEDKVDADALSGVIEVKGVTFAYDDDSPNVLNDINFKVSAGEHVAIVGKSGCGKSTLIRLLLGFEKPQKGAIYYDGQDLEDLNLASVRVQMGIVLQNGQIMAGDIFTNIIGTSSLTQDDAWQAAEAAGLADDIRKMPMGMNTVISEGSTNISGGQRQRILIARAIASKPSIIVFDEATSALDNRTQNIVTESLDKMNATQIIVAHRLSTIRNCDKIIVMDSGKIVDIGTFDELANRERLFSDLIKRQQTTQI